MWAPRGGQRAPINCEKLFLTIWKVKTLQRWERGLTAAKSSNKKSRQQNQEQNSTNNNPETVRARWRRVPRSPKAGLPKTGFGPGLWGPQSVGAPKGGAPNLEKVGPRRVWGPKFRAFVPFAATIFILEVVSWNSWCD